MGSQVLRVSGWGVSEGGVPVPSFEKGAVRCLRDYFGFRIRAEGESVFGQGLVNAGDDPGVGGQQAVLGSPLGGGNQAVDRIELQGAPPCG